RICLQGTEAADSRRTPIPNARPADAGPFAKAGARAVVAGGLVRRVVLLRPVRRAAVPHRIAAGGHRRRVPPRALALPRPLRRAVPHQTAGPLRRDRAVLAAVRRSHGTDRSVAVGARGDRRRTAAVRPLSPRARGPRRAVRRTA